MIGIIVIIMIVSCSFSVLSTDLQGGSQTLCSAPQIRKESLGHRSPSLHPSVFIFVSLFASYLAILFLCCVQVPSRSFGSFVGEPVQRPGAAQVAGAQKRAEGRAAAAGGGAGGGARREARDPRGFGVKRHWAAGRLKHHITYL